MFSINRWVDILQRNTQGTHKSTQGRHVALYMKCERGFLGDEKGYTRVGFWFKLYSCIGFSSYNKERFLSVNVGLMIELNHVKYCVSFIFHTCDLFIIKLLYT